MSDSASEPSFRAAKSGRVRVTFKSDQARDFILKFFPYRVVSLLKISSVLRYQMRVLTG